MSILRAKAWKGSVLCLVRDLVMMTVHVPMASDLVEIKDGYIIPSKGGGTGEVQEESTHHSGFPA